LTGHHPAYETKRLTKMWRRREDDFEPVMVIAKVWDSVVDSSKHCWTYKYFRFMYANCVFHTHTHTHICAVEPEPTAVHWMFIHT